MPFRSTKREKTRFSAFFKARETPTPTSEKIRKRDKFKAKMKSFCNRIRFHKSAKVVDEQPELESEPAEPFESAASQPEIDLIDSESVYEFVPMEPIKPDVAPKGKITEVIGAEDNVLETGAKTTEVIEPVVEAEVTEFEDEVTESEPETIEVEAKEVYGETDVVDVTESFDWDSDTDSSVEDVIEHEIVFESDDEMEQFVFFEIVTPENYFYESTGSDSESDSDSDSSVEETVYEQEILFVAEDEVEEQQILEEVSTPDEVINEFIHQSPPKVALPFRYFTLDGLEVDLSKGIVLPCREVTYSLGLEFKFIPVEGYYSVYPDSTNLSVEKCPPYEEDQLFYLRIPLESEEYIERLTQEEKDEVRFCIVKQYQDEEGHEFKTPAAELDEFPLPYPRSTNTNYDVFVDWESKEAPQDTGTPPMGEEPVSTPTTPQEELFDHNSGLSTNSDPNSVDVAANRCFCKDASRSPNELTLEFRSPIEDHNDYEEYINSEKTPIMPPKVLPKPILKARHFVPSDDDLIWESDESFADLMLSKNYLEPVLIFLDKEPADDGVDGWWDEEAVLVGGWFADGSDGQRRCCRGY